MENHRGRSFDEDNTSQYGGRISREHKYYEGWLEHKQKREWIKYWVVVRGKNLWIFSSARTDRREEYQGNLPLNGKTKLSSTKPSKKGPFTFTLTSQDDEWGIEKINEFRCEDHKHLIEWRGYIESLSFGYVPENFRRELLPGQRQALEDALADQQKMVAGTCSSFSPNSPRPTAGSTVSSHISRLSSGSDSPGLSPNPGQRSFGTSSRTKHEHTGINSIRSSHSPARTRRPSDTLPGIEGGPPFSPSSKYPDKQSYTSETIKMNHRFTNNANNQNIPSWFFGSSSREKVCELLTLGKKFGNVLIRESSSFPSTGMYTLTMRQDNQLECPVFYNYLVKPSGRFYIIEMEDVEFPPMTCLSDVMDGFISSASTHHRGYNLSSMKTNNLQDFGPVKESLYDIKPPFPKEMGRPESGIEYDLPPTDSETDYNLQNFFPTMSPVKDKPLPPAPDSDSMHDTEEWSNGQGFFRQNFKSVYIAQVDDDDRVYVNTPEFMRQDIPMPTIKAPAPPPVSPKVGTAPPRAPPSPTMNRSQSAPAPGLTFTPAPPPGPTVPPTAPVPPPIDSIPKRTDGNRLDRVHPEPKLHLSHSQPAAGFMEMNELAKKIQESQLRRQSQPSLCRSTNMLQVPPADYDDNEDYQNSVMISCRPRSNSVDSPFRRLDSSPMRSIPDSPLDSFPKNNNTIEVDEPDSELQKRLQERMTKMSVTDKFGFKSLREALKSSRDET